MNSTRATDDFFRDCVDLHHVEITRRLAVGTSSSIWLAEDRQMKEARVLKMLKKDQDQDIAAIKVWTRECSDEQGQSTFILGVVDVLHTKQDIILMTEYMPGGDLATYVSQIGKLELAVARFYAAELCHALSFIHQKGIIHRNVGLEHVLIDANGHIRVIGFGCCKDNMKHESRTTTFCGGLSMAPEILLDRPYGRAVDWWGFGISLFEMLEARSPFQGDDEDAIFDEILDDSKPQYPREMPGRAKSILQQLFLRDPDARLGARGDAREVMLHSFFDEIAWDDVAHERMPPPTLKHRRNTIESAEEVPNMSLKGLGLCDWERLDVFGDF